MSAHINTNALLEHKTYAALYGDSEYDEFKGAYGDVMNIFKIQKAKILPIS